MARGVILLAIFCLFLLRLAGQQHGFEAIRQIPEGQLVTVSGMIYKKELKGEDGLYYLKNVELCEEKADISIDDCRILLRTNSGEYRVGQVIEARCNMRWMDEASNAGGFDEQAYYHSLGIDTLLYCDQRPIVTKQKKKCQIRNGLSALREKMRGVYTEHLNEKDAGILASMVLGDKSLMEDELKQLYSSAGISHILAVSGLHVSIIGMTLFQLLRKRGLKYLPCCLVSGIVLLLFCVMSGLSVSALRAGIMFLIFLGAQLLGRKYNSLRALAVAAVITLLANPSFMYNAGFLLSYFAVFGAVAVAPVLTAIKRAEEKALSKNKGKIHSWIRGNLNSMILSSSIMLTTLPLNAYFFYEIPMYGILANLVVIPLAGILMGFGLLGGLLGAIPFAWIVFIPCHLILRLYEAICQGLQWLPLDVWITGRPPVWLMMLYYSILVFLVWAFYYKDEMRRYMIKKILVLVISVSMMAIMFVQPPARQMQISFLDVGQGDGIYINGGDGKQYFVDGGSTSETELGRYTILPFLKYHRVRQIDVWFVSHADTDHISGLLEVLEKGYAIETILISELAPEDDNLLALKAAAKEAGTQVITVANGTFLAGEGYRIICYTPETLDMENRNQASLVNLLEYEKQKKHVGLLFRRNTEQSKEVFRVLLTGDIGAEQETWLLEQEGIGEVDVLKAAHHGSKYSNSQAFLQALRPELTIISCSKNNLYGHPHEETLERIKNVGSDILLTMEAGEITLKQ